MNLSEETQTLISELNAFSGSKVRNIGDLGMLAEAAKISNKNNLFGDLMFTAKYLNGLGRILQVGGIAHLDLDQSDKGKIKPDASDKIMQEFKEHLKTFMDNLEELIEPLGDGEKREFTEKYLSHTQESLINLTRLIYDLSWLKKFRNIKKEK